MDLGYLREQFPSLQRKFDGHPAVFLDGPGGSQVPRRVMDAMVGYLSRSNANCGGSFATSDETGQMLTEAHQAAADLLGGHPDEIVFGANMTTLTFHLSRAFARTLRPGDEVIVTRLDHDANVSPWALAARDAGATMKKVDIHVDDCSLDLEDLARQLSPKTRLVAVTAASNLTGTLTDIPRIREMVHAAGALLYVDAVHAAPHIPIDVSAWGCDFLACSAYKFFGPHVGILWGRRKWLEDLPAYKVRPASDYLPWRWMTGTQNHEGLAGVTAAISYLKEVGLPTIRAYEQELAAHFLEEIARFPQFKLWGTKDLSRRVPTFALTSSEATPAELAERLAKHHIFAWAGNMYAIELTERLGIEATGSALRLGLMHYNTHEEISRTFAALVG